MTTGRGPWEWSASEKRLIYFVYEFWHREHRPPNQADICSALGIDDRDARALARGLREGFALTFDDERVVLSIDKAPPFSATPTAVACFLGDDFLTYVGCVMEMTSLSMLPMLEGVTVTVRTSCACCYSPVEIRVRDGEVLDSSPADPIVTAIRSPWDFEQGVTTDRVCDSFQLVLDADHAESFERKVMRRGVRLTLSQSAQIGRSAGEGRMRDPHWRAIRLDARTMIDSWEAVGVDVAAWRRDP